MADLHETLDGAVTPDEIRSTATIVDVLAVFFVSLITGTIGVSIGAAIGGAGSFAETSGSLIGLWAGLIPGAIVVSRSRGTGSLVRDYGLRLRLPTDFMGVVAGLASQFVMLPIIYVVVQALANHDLTKELEAPAKDLSQNVHGPGFFLLAVLLVVGAPVVEEIFYRGMLLGALRRHMGEWPSILLCGLIFGAAHFELLQLPGLAAFGCVLAWLYSRSGRLGPNILAHAAFNAATVVFLWHG